MIDMLLSLLGCVNLLLQSRSTEQHAVLGACL